jgi:2-polyprenyl-3-methyl-5-hydroxy-6-metoxy-1,4-benzoquinol methylase
MTLCPKREYFNDLAVRWDCLPGPPNAEDKLKRFVSRAAPAAARRILDVGCGTGILVEPLGNTTARIVELDSAEQMLLQSRRKSSGRVQVQHVCADAGSLPFRSASFDAILCFNVLPHLEPLAGALECMIECLERGGVLSVGHLMGSGQLNAFHASLNGPVSGDRLPSAERLAGMLKGMGAGIVCAEEAPDWYFVQARKCG